MKVMKKSLMMFLVCLMLTNLAWGQDSLGVRRVASRFNYWLSANSVAVQGNQAFVATGYSGLQSLDLQHDDRPLVEGYNDNVIPYDVIYSGDYVYFLDVLLGFVVATDDNIPQVISNYGGAVGATTLEMQNDVVFIGMDAGGVLILDISDPESPDSVSSFETPDEVRHMHLRDTLLYLNDSPDTLRIFNVSDLDSVSLLGSLGVEGLIHDLFVINSTALLANEEDALRLIDVTNPEEPAEVGVFDSGRWFRPTIVTALDTIAYVISGNLLYVLDISEPDNPENLERLLLDLGGFTDCAISENHLLLTTDIQEFIKGIQRVDISDPLEPDNNGWYVSLGRATEVTVLNNTAYLLESNSGGGGHDEIEFDEFSPGIRLINIATPQEPQSLSTIQYYAFLQIPPHFTVTEDRMYISKSWLGISIYDTEDRRRPRFIDRLEPDDCEPNYIAADESCIYFYNNHDLRGLQIFDVSDPDTFIEMESLANFSFSDIVVEDDIAYTARGNAGIALVDVSGRENPEVIGFTGGTRTYIVAVQDDFAYFTAKREQVGLWILDVADPSDPFETAFLPFEERYIYDLDVDEDFAVIHYLVVPYV